MKIATVCSMLHEPATANSAARLFRSEPVLAWTLQRIGQCERIGQMAILCWRDQFDHVEPIAAELDAFCSVKTGRGTIPHLESLAAASRWTDGWRGGPLGCCTFDRGFAGNWLLDIQKELAADALLLIDPASGLVDPDLIDSLIDHAEKNEDLDFYFSQAAPGLSGVLIRPNLLSQLAAGNLHPGALVSYRPDLPLRDPISSRSCMQVPAPLARTTQRFTLDSSSQIARIGQATEHLNGELITTESAHLLHILAHAPDPTDLPREIVLELTPRRASTPVYWPGRAGKIEREDLMLQSARSLFAEISEADDMRITFGGVGDPLLHPEVLQIVQGAREAGIGAIAVETDLLGISSDLVERLTAAPVDIISIFMPAMNAKSYQAMMGVDGLKEAISHLKRLIEIRQLRALGTPLLIPTFVKTTVNFGEMEGWYDHWLKTLGSAVIVGPDHAPELAVADMCPPRRKACSRLERRLTILSDGRVVSCEMDVHGRQTLGQIGKHSIHSIWTGTMRNLRREHSDGTFTQPTCSGCREWHRP